MTAFEKMVLAVRDLASFEQVCAERRAIRRADENSRQEEFVIDGHYMLDCFGQVGRMTIYGEGGYGRPVPAEDLKIPRVLTKAMFDAIVKERGFGYSFGFPCPIPKAGMVCPECGVPFTLENCFSLGDGSGNGKFEILDAPGCVGMTLAEALKTVQTPEKECYHYHGLPLANQAYVNLTLDKYRDPLNEHGLAAFDESEARERFTLLRVPMESYRLKPGDQLVVNSYQYFHADCYATKLANTTKAEFAACLEASGLRFNQDLQPCENAYGSGYYNGPWYKVQLESGDFLTIGWRKRVIEVSYPDSDGSMMSIFADANVTNEPGLVHAWGYEQLTDFLGRLARHWGYVS